MQTMWKHNGPHSLNALYFNVQRICKRTFKKNLMTIKQRETTLIAILEIRRDSILLNNGMNLTRQVDVSFF